MVNLFSGHGLSRKWPIGAIYKFLFSRLKPDFVEFDGHKISLPKKDIGDVAHDISLLKTWGDKNEVGVLKSEIKKGDVVLDLGAHIGYYTLLVAKLVGENGKVYAFEPDPNNFECLIKNIEQNGYKNVVCVNKAVSNKTGKSQLFISDETDNSQMVIQEGNESVSVDTTTIDEFFKNKNERVDFIKMDIEGSESNALQGMQNLLEKNKDIKILTEFFPDRLKHTVGAEKYLEMLEKQKFKFYDITTNKNVPVSKEHLLKTYLVDVGKFQKGRFTNVLCVRN